jgi:hypothetical protein
VVVLDCTPTIGSPNPSPNLYPIEDVGFRDYPIPQGEFCLSASSSLGGIFLQKSFYVDLVTPGAYIGGHLDRSCVRAFACGNVGWQPITNERSRQASLYKRIATITTLEDIVLEVSPLRRSCLILKQLSQWLGQEALQQIPTELIAKMAAVHPEKIAIATQLRSSPKHRHLVAKLTRKPPISKIHRITFGDTLNKP